MNKELLEAYKYHRDRRSSYTMRDLPDMTARQAIGFAREDVAKSKRRYTTQWSWQCNAINPKWSAFGEKHLRYIEARGNLWRFVGYADEVAKQEGNWRSIDHTGWFLDDFHDDKARGVVYQLPGRKGEPQYIAGYSCSYDEDGAIALSFDDIYTDKMEAARAADGIAERMAEHEREYREADQAGLRWSELGDEIEKGRYDLRALIRELKAIRATEVLADHPEICAALKRRIADLRDDMHTAWKKREELWDGYHRCDGFKEHLPA